MVKRVLRQGIEADYLLADAWFGSKAVLRLCEDTHLVGILRMKKGKLKYRVTDWVNGQLTQRELDAKALYKHSVRKQWEPIPGQKYQAKAVDVEVNLAANKKDDDHWLQVRLLFVRGAVAEDHQSTDTSSKDWALFIATDPNLSATRILECYAMRWAIEVYFKEAKQHLGLLKEQSNHYAAYIASIHLTAIRFCLLIMAKQTLGAQSLCGARDGLCSNSQKISFASQLWAAFKAIITGALDSLSDHLGMAVDTIMETLQDHMEIFFTQVLQLDPKMLRYEE